MAYACTALWTLGVAASEDSQVVSREPPNSTELDGRQVGQVRGEMGRSGLYGFSTDKGFTTDDGNGWRGGSGDVV